MILTIFLALVSESEPPNTVKSCAKTYAGRAVDRAVAGDESVAVDHLLLHAEIGGAVPDQLVGFFERAFVEQQIDALARREFAFPVLARAALVASSGFGSGVAAAQFVQSIRH